MFEQNNLAAEAAWREAQAHMALIGSSYDDTHRYDFVLLVRLTGDGRLVAKQTGTSRELIGLSRAPNQFDRKLGGPLDLEAKCAFMTDGDLLVWRDKNTPPEA